MRTQSSASGRVDRERQRRAHSSRLPEQKSLAEMKKRQAAKVGEIADALVSSGYHTLVAQAEVLELGRSTTWTIMKHTCKNSGLSATTINRIWLSQRLPIRVRVKVVEYSWEKAAGLYGHCLMQRRRFIARLADGLLADGLIEGGCVDRPSKTMRNRSFASRKRAESPPVGE
jgi:hypothetical protein